ncbi:hypothetical protein SADUNF_Sadunf07G0007800 [Salix dunnii]|uniref:Uncharacterized protein n=1 Tax=Salix dunnii TaxID=1413687 RepID=A0A835K2A3_9ROSI|nr:hypothetical protein SADUNF_Sadunf07G0007800 [Salix dunnii]
MAMSMMRSALLRNSLRSASKSSAPTRRGFSSSANHDDAYEAAKWEKITYLGAATCTILAIYNLSRGHHHSETPPEYPYLHIRNKEFPWGYFVDAAHKLYWIVANDQMDSLRLRRTITENLVLDGNI